MQIYVSLSQTTTDKNRDRPSSPEANTGRVDVSEYASLEKKLRLTEEAKDKEKLAQKAGGGDSVKGKKGAKKDGAATKPKDDDSDNTDDDADSGDDADFGFDGGDDDADDSSDDSGDDSDGKSKPKKGGKKSKPAGDDDSADAEDADADESEGDDGDADAEGADDEGDE